MESHAIDLENYVNVARNRRRRAKALLDFERHDDDELGFRKNDVITVSHFLYWLCIKSNNISGFVMPSVRLLSLLILTKTHRLK